MLLQTTKLSDGDGDDDDDAMHASLLLQTTTIDTTRYDTTRFL
jgi:hypothetical protein